MTVLQFKRPVDQTIPKDHTPISTKLATGIAVCMTCKHEWNTAAPVGTLYLQCPECETMKGRFKYPFNVKSGEYQRICDCGNDLFYITPKGHLCPNCGNYQEY